MEGLPESFNTYFVEMINILDKIERWWIVNLEIPLNDDLVDLEIDESKIIPGPVASLKMMLDVALGTDDQAEFYINEFKKAGFFNSK